MEDHTPRPLDLPTLDLHGSEETCEKSLGFPIRGWRDSRCAETGCLHSDTPVLGEDKTLPQLLGFLASGQHCSVRATAGVWSPICCPDKGTTVGALVTQIWDFFPVVKTVYDQKLLVRRLFETLLRWVRLRGERWELRAFTSDAPFHLRVPVPTKCNNFGSSVDPHASLAPASGQGHCTKRSDLQVLSRFHWTPQHLDACLLRKKPASLAAASGDNPSATSVKATRPLQCGRMPVFDRQDHESSCPAAKRVLTLRIGAVRVVYSSHARHVSTWLIVPASYDEYTALVKSGNVASKHFWRAVSGT